MATITGSIEICSKRNNLWLTNFNKNSMNTHKGMTTVKESKIATGKFKMAVSKMNAIEKHNFLLNCDTVDHFERFLFVSKYATLHILKVYLQLCKYNVF